MYSLSDVKQVLEHPYQIGREINLLYHRLFRLRDHNPDGVDFVDKDWDNLVILDACRYDKFEKHNSLPGDLESITSKASSSDEFVYSNFHEKELYDTVILTANSWYFKYETNAHAVIDFRDDNPQGWLTPDRFTKFVEGYLDEFPDKRFVIHYMTPHSPYFGPTGWKYLNREYVNNERDIRYVIQKDKYDATVSDLETAYEENLQIVLNEVEQLLPQLQGRTVVTADHGEMLGERHFPFPMRDYQHHHGIYTEELTEVPWLTYENGERKTIKSELPSGDTSENDDTDMTVVNDRLKDLGYVDPTDSH